MFVARKNVNLFSLVLTEMQNNTVCTIPFDLASTEKNKIDSSVYYVTVDTRAHRKLRNVFCLEFICTLEFVLEIITLNYS